MADTHYVEFTPDEIWMRMMTAYRQAGGQVLYPGDEKEMLLRSVQSIVVQTLVGVDTALMQDTLRYAVGSFLDVYGEKRNCVRIAAAAAECEVKITFSASGVTKVIPKGTALTVDGRILYRLKANITQSGAAQTLYAQIVCDEFGAAGNGLADNTDMQFAVPQAAVTEVVTTRDAAGGRDAEDDETYRERIRTYGLANVTTGPKESYESKAKEVSTLIVDARAVNGGAGEVDVYLLLSTQTGAQGVIDAVEEALSADTVRPLTDTVTVAQCTNKVYTLNVEYMADAGTDVSGAIAEAKNEYEEWQNNTIGRPFNPDKLIALIYNAGATRVTFGSGSVFDGGDVEYTEIPVNAHCTGTITLTQVTE